MGQSGLTATNGYFCGMNYQQITVISAGTNRIKMRNLMPPVGLAGMVPLVF